MKDGIVFDELPPEAPRSRPIADVDWESLALLAQANPGKAIKASDHIRVSRITSVRGYRRAPFITDEGQIKISMRGSAVEDDGHRYGQVWFTWEPKKKTIRKAK